MLVDLSGVTDLIEREALKRQDLHKHHASSRPLVKGYEVTGMAGEFALGEVLGLYPDVSVRLKGDDHIDFNVLLHYSIDVKCSKRAEHLLHAQGSKFADIFVLAEYNDETKAVKLLGWEWGSVLQKAKVSDMLADDGVMAHFIRYDKLRGMPELLDRVFKIKARS